MASVVLAAGADAQTVRMRIDTDTLSLGARYDLTVTIRHDGTRHALFPDELPVGDIPEGLVSVAGDLELLSRKSSGSRMLPDDSRLDSVHYEFVTFVVDTARVQAAVGLTTETDTTFFAAVPGTIPVRSVVPEDAEDILDLAPLVEFPRAIWPWLLALAVAGFAFWYFLIRKRPVELVPESSTYVEPAEPPFDEAMRRLRALSQGAPDGAAMKPYFVELSDIVRTYVARKTRVPARELTTGELVGRLSNTPILHDDRISEVGMLLTAADLVKFADHRPGGKAALSALNDARASIERTEADLAPAAPEERRDLATESASQPSGDGQAGTSPWVPGGDT